MRLLWLFLILSTSTALGQSAERGMKLYQDKWCHSCHGTAGQGGERGAGPKLAPNPFPYEAFAAQTRRPRMNMPRYPVEHLSDAELADIYAYLASVKSRPAKDIPQLRD
jgi:mono/diheme cytochrome c family protein